HSVSKVALTPGTLATSATIPRQADSVPSRANPSVRPATQCLPPHLAAVRPACRLRLEPGDTCYFFAPWRGATRHVQRRDDPTTGRETRLRLSSSVTHRKA